MGLFGDDKRQDERLDALEQHIRVLTETVLLDDLTPLHQIDAEVIDASYQLLKPRDAYRIRGGGFNIPSGPQGANPPNGAVIHYTLSEEEPRVDLTLRSQQGGQAQLVEHDEEYGCAKINATPL